MTAITQVLNAVGALFLVMALARGKASIVAPTTNALAPALTVIISLIAYQTLPSPVRGGDRHRAGARRFDVDGLRR